MRFAKEHRHCVGLQIKFTWGRKLLSDFVFRKEPIEIAFKQLVLYDSIFFKFGFGMEFCLFSTDFPPDQLATRVH